MPRMLEKLECPRKGLVGPWGHEYPHEAVSPGPAIDWLTEALRWWDHWLKGVETGIMAEPMYRLWMQAEPAMRGMRTIPGRWVAEETWPSPRMKSARYFLTAQGLTARPASETLHVLRSLQTVGICAPRWATAAPWLDTDLPVDQRIDDARSLTFDSQPLLQGFEILGAPAVTVELSVDRPVAFLAVRLNEVEPGGASKRISYGVLNLTHRDSDEFPAALQPGARYRIRVQLQDCAHSFKVGNRIRVAMSTTYWPAFWPSPEAVTLSVHAGKSELELPIRPPRPADAQLHTFGEAFVPQTSGMTSLAQAKALPTIREWDVAAQKLTIRCGFDGGKVRLDATGTELSASMNETTEIVADDPTSARLERRATAAFKRGAWDTSVESVLRLRLTMEHFLLSCEIKAYDSGREFFTRTWERKIGRQLL